MNTTTPPRSILVAAAALLAGCGLAGCTTADDVLNKTKTTTSDSPGSMIGAIPAWVPDDATAITRVQARGGEATSILLTSEEELDADLCTSTPRLSAPTMEVDGAPDVYGSDGDTVFSCGDWTVMAGADGWYGWTPVTEDTTSTSSPTPSR